MSLVATGVTKSGLGNSSHCQTVKHREIKGKKGAVGEGGRRGEATDEDGEEEAVRNGF